MLAQAAVEQAQANAQGHSHDVRDPVVDVGAAVEAGLDELNGAPEGTRADEDRQQPEAARSGQREGERGEGYEVHQFVASLRRRGRLLRGLLLSMLLSTQPLSAQPRRRRRLPCCLRQARRARTARTITLPHSAHDNAVAQRTITPPPRP